jgi:hypothetical protein
MPPPGLRSSTDFGATKHAEAFSRKGGDAQTNG